MATAAVPQDAAPTPPRRRPLLAVLATLAAAGAGFGATSLLLPARPPEPAARADARPAPLGDIAFVPVPPLVISLGPGAENRHLRLAVQIEAEGPYAAEVERLIPRILDVLNGYLRAIDLAELQDPAALVRIRSQLLRRIQVVTGEGRVRDLLVTEFVLN